MIKKNFKSVLLYSALYLALVGVAHFFLLILISFIHFLLDHSLSIIEAWVFERGYSIIVLSKIMAFLVMAYILNIYTEHLGPIKYFFKKSLVMPSKKVIVVLLFLILFSFFYGRPEDKDTFELTNILSSYIGTILFYFFDVLIFLFLNRIFSLSEKEKLFFVLIAGIASFLVMKLSFLYALNIHLSVALHFVFCFYLTTYLRLNWTIPLCYLAFYLAPISAFFGQDVVSKELHSPMNFTQDLNFHIYFVLILVSFSYLRFSSRFKKRG